MSGIWLDHTFRVVAVGSALLGAVSGAAGSFAVLRRQGLLGDGISHASLAGVAAAFLLTGSRESGVLLCGALLSGLLAVFWINAAVRRARVKPDGALALGMSSLFGLGLALLSLAQKRPDASQAGLKQFLYGQASALLERDLILLAAGGAVLLAVLLLFWKEFCLMTFDPGYAAGLGLPARRLEALYSLLLAGNILIGLQTVGAVLMSALLIAPAVAARQWTDRMGRMAALAAAFGAASGVGGTLAGAAAPDLPTGPMIVICAVLLAGASLLAAPGRGIVSRFLRQKRMERGKRPCRRERRSS